MLRRDRTTPEECQGILSSGPLPFPGSRTVYPARVQSSTTWMRMTAPIHCAAKSGWPGGMILIVKGIQNSCNMVIRLRKILYLIYLLDVSGSMYSGPGILRGSGGRIV
jgi:hypothetical protein